MSQNYYKLYIDSVLDLAQTLVIKSEESATSINNYIKMVYGEEYVDQYDLTSWKYYKNICGEYHFTDSPIVVTSLDTLEKITFSVENLQVHKATNLAYQYGTRQYNELISNYPDKEQLIIGILYPADMDIAINAPDGTILSYPKYLVESNELTFIEKLNRSIEVYKIRWHNSQFAITDSLYSAAHMGLLYLNLIPMILNIRLAACKTNEAHSFHVRQYLASHGMLDVYLDNMTTKQALFFYRNIAYIERNSGKREIFYWLIEHIMTERGLPLSEFTMKHNEVGMLDNLYPTITFRKKLLNISYSAQEKDSYTLTEILDKEKYLVTGNKDYIDKYDSTILSKFNNSLSSVVATKMLESSVIDYTDATPYTLQNILLNEWLDLSSKNIYNVYFSFKNPYSDEKLTLIAKDAFIYLMFNFARSIGSDIDRIPSFIALRAQRIPRPTVDDLMSVVDTSYIDTSIAEQIIDTQPNIPPDKAILSVEAFYNQAQEVYKAAQTQIGIISSQQHQYRRGLVYNMVCRMYTDNVIHFPEEGMLFSEWLFLKNLPTTPFTIQESRELYKNIYEAATGVDLNTTDSISNLQKAMVGLFQQLSSYSIQVVSEINDSNIRVTNWGIIRTGDIGNKQIVNYQLPGLLIDTLNLDGIINSKENFVVNTPDLTFRDSVKLENIYLVNIPVKASLKDLNSIHQVRPISFGSISITATVNGVEASADQNSPLLGFNEYLSLSDSDKKTFKDIYLNS